MIIHISAIIKYKLEKYKTTKAGLRQNFVLPQAPILIRAKQNQVNLM
jgi:hypothetical protein